MTENQDNFLQNDLKAQVDDASDVDTIQQYLPNGFMIQDSESEIEEVSAPLKTLLQEHRTIRTLFALIPRLLDRNDYWGNDSHLFNQLIQIMHHYIVKYHFLKEEDVLFKFIDEDSQLLHLMKYEHDSSRKTIQDIIQAYKNKNAEVLRISYLQFIAVFENHMRREETLVYSWINKTLSADQLSELTEDFDRIDSIQGGLVEAEIFSFLDNAETEFKKVKPGIFPFSSTKEFLIEKLVNHSNIAINHLVLPSGGKIDGHISPTHMYFIITHGMIHVKHSHTQEENYIQGNIIHIPAGTYMELFNEGPAIFEMFVVRAPNVME